MVEKSLRNYVASASLVDYQGTDLASTGQGAGIKKKLTIKQRKPNFVLLEVVQVELLIGEKLIYNYLSYHIYSHLETDFQSSDRKNYQNPYLSDMCALQGRPSCLTFLLVGNPMAIYLPR